MARLTGWLGFVTLWAGQSISLVGTGMYAFGVGVFVYQRTQSATLFGLILFFEMLPGVIVGPYVGVLADRVNRRLVMLVGNGGMIVGAALMLLATMGDQVNVWVLYPALVVGSVFAACHTAAYESSIALLMPAARWNRANGLVQLGEAIANVSAPLAAGALLVVLHIQGLVLLDIATFAVAFGALLLMAVPDVATQPADVPKSRLREDLVYGWRFIRSSGGLPTMLLLSSMLNFFVNIAVVGATPLILSFTDPATFGAVAAAGGAGMVVGGLTMVVWKGPSRRLPLLLTGLCGTGVFIALYGVRPAPVLVAVAQFGFFFCLPIVNSMSAGIWQHRVPPEVQGRVFAVRRMLVTVMVPLAILIAGPLIDHVFRSLLTGTGGLVRVFGPALGTGPGRGIGLLFVLLGVAMLVTTLVAAANPRLRSVETPAVQPATAPPSSAATPSGA